MAYILHILSARQRNDVRNKEGIVADSGRGGKVKNFCRNFIDNFQNLHNSQNSL